MEYGGFCHLCILVMLVLFLYTYFDNNIEGKNLYN